jgi:uncharacterized protein (TIGR02588 family)
MSQAERDTSNRTSKPEQNQSSPRSLAEWFTFGTASFVLLGIIGLVIYLWLSREYQQLPEVSVSNSSEVREAGGQFYVPFTVVNMGGSTAESVQIIAELIINGKIEESGEQQIDFLSGGETEEGAFVFTHNPQSGELRLRVASYKLP